MLKIDPNNPLVIVAALRTPVGQAGKSLSGMESHELGAFIAEETIRTYAIRKEWIDCVVAGEIGQSSKAPNVARVVSVRTGLPLEAPAVTIANNCVSGYEAITESARRIMTGEATFVLALGMENMSLYHFYLQGAKGNPKSSTVEKIKANWPDLLSMGVDVIDSLEEGLTDPVRLLNMAMTGEVAAQNYDLDKKTLDDYAYNSYRKTYEAIVAGKYAPFIAPVQTPDGLLEHDEFIMSKRGMVENRDRFYRASPIFDSKYMSLKEFYEKYGRYIRKPYVEGVSSASLTLFNSCPRSDGAGAAIVTTLQKALDFGLTPLAILRSWGNYGVDPVYMGIGMAYAMKRCLDHAGMEWKDVAGFELHEAFAATAIGAMREVKEKYGFDLEKMDESGLVNPHGGTLAIGHPLGATGIRMLINQIMHLRERNVDNCLGAICAGGGVAGSILIERYSDRV
jgi:acetyl-CoA C-acetyltransferase